MNSLSEGLHKLCSHSSPHIITMIKSRRMKRSGYITRIRVMRNAYKIFVGKSEGEKPLGRPSRRWEDNIKLHTGYDSNGLDSFG
jgi:hypothetical protein